MDQWTLNRCNFEGQWRGRGAWFGRDATEKLDLTSPIRVIDPTTYDISFSDPDNGVWDGSGLFFAPGGRATYSISRDTYNEGGGCWQFQGAGGQSSLSIDPGRGRFGHEINLFHKRSRSMVVLIWEPVAADWCLQSIGAVGFRCRNVAYVEPERRVWSAAESLLESMRGWPGRVETFAPFPGSGGRVSEPRSGVFDPDQFLCHGCSAAMPDGLVFSVPEQLPKAAFQLEIGGLLGAELFQQISILFDADGLLTAWERRRFKPEVN